jgi:tRNA (adenine57-N1/adenine58-N1)-methyltransferase
LKPSGVLISISPTVNQTEIMCELMRRNGFILVDTYEVLVRRFLAREGKSRPYENMIAHTAYISVGRKIEN